MAPAGERTSNGVISCPFPSEDALITLGGVRNGLRLFRSGYRRLSAGVFPDSAIRSNVGMLAVGDGPPIGGGWGSIHGGCAVVSSPTVADGGCATTSSPPNAAGATDKSTFVCWIAGLPSNDSGGGLQLSIVRLDLVRDEVPTKDSGGSLGTPLSYRRCRRAGLLSVGRLPAARRL